MQRLTLFILPGAPSGSPRKRAARRRVEVDSDDEDEDGDDDVDVNEDHHDAGDGYGPPIDEEYPDGGSQAMSGGK